MSLTVIAAVPLLIWIYLLAGRKGFWRISRYLTLPKAKPFTAARVIAVIPARNEASVIRQSLRSLSRQNIHVIVVDDGSTDGTAEIAHAAGGNVTVLAGRPLAPGWTGKLWALSQGVEYAQMFQPDYLLFTDADIQHSPESVTELLARAEEEDCDLVSHMVKLSCITLAEKLLIPAFVFLFLMLYPPEWIASEGSKVAGAAGGCILIRSEALRRIGGLAAIQSEVIDDCALAREVKRKGGRIRMGLTASTESIRSYGSFAEIGRMISRTAFNQLRHSTLLLIAALIGLFFTFLLPPLLLCTGSKVPAVLGAAAWLLMSVCYVPMAHFYKRPAIWSLSLPAVALFYAGATIHSALRYWCGRGGEWKGRAQDARFPRSFSN